MRTRKNHCGRAPSSQGTSPALHASSQLRALSLIALLASTSTSTACPGRLGDACNFDSECDAGELCLAGFCQAPVAPTITSVNGDGTSLAPTLAPSSLPEDVDDARPAANRVRNALVVTGRDLAQVRTAFLLDAQNIALPLTINEGSGDTNMTLTFSSPLAAAGLFTLTLVATNSVARAQVFVLQGEPGVTSLVEPRDVSDTSVCPNGGVALTFGLDLDRDGVLDDDEEDASQARVICNGANGAAGANGDSVFTCSGDVCDTDLDVRIGGHPLVGVVDQPTTVLVPGDAPTIAGAIELFRGLKVAAPVTLFVGGDVHTESERVLIDHPDAHLMRIEGSLPGGATVLDFPSSSDGIIVSGTRFGGIDNLRIRGRSALGTSGVVVRENGSVRVGAGVTSEGFGNGFFVTTGGTLVANNARSAGNATTGFFVANGATLLALGARVDNNPFGITVQSGSALDATNCTVSSTETAVTVAEGASARVPGCVLSGRNALFLEGNATVFAQTASLNAIDAALLVQHSSFVNCFACAQSGIVSVDETSQLID